MENRTYSLVFLLAFLLCTGLTSAQPSYVVIKSECYAKNNNDSTKLFAGEVFRRIADERIMLGSVEFQLSDRKLYEPLPDSVVKSQNFLKFSSNIALDKIVNKHGSDSILIDISSLITIDSNLTIKLFGYKDTMSLSKRKPKLYVKGSRLDKLFRFSGKNIPSLVFDRDKYYQDDERKNELMIESLKNSVDSLKNEISKSYSLLKEEKSRWLYGSILSVLLGFLLGGLGYWFVTKKKIKEVEQKLNKESEKRVKAETDLSLLERNNNSANRSEKSAQSADDIKNQLLAKVAKLENESNLKDKEIDRLNREIIAEKEKSAFKEASIGTLNNQLHAKESEVFFKLNGWQEFADLVSTTQRHIRAAVDEVSSVFRQFEVAKFSEGEHILFNQMLSKFFIAEGKYSTKALKWLAVVDLMQKGNGTIVDQELLQNIKNETDIKVKIKIFTKMFLKESCQHQVSNVLVLLEEVRVMPQILETPTDELSRFCNEDVENIINSLRRELEKTLGAEISYVRLFQAVSEDPGMLGVKNDKEIADTLYLRRRSKTANPRTIIEILKYGIQSDFFDADQRRTNVIVKSDS